MLKLCVVHEGLLDALTSIEQASTHVEVINVFAPTGPHAYLLVNCARRGNVPPNANKIVAKYASVFEEISRRYLLFRTIDSTTPVLQQTLDTRATLDNQLTLWRTLSNGSVPRSMVQSAVAKERPRQSLGYEADNDVEEKDPSVQQRYGGRRKHELNFDDKSVRVETLPGSGRLVFNERPEVPWVQKLCQKGCMVNLSCAESDPALVRQFTNVFPKGHERAYHALQMLLSHILSVLSCGGVVNLVGVSRETAKECLAGKQSPRLETRPGWAVSECSRRAYFGQERGIDTGKYTKVVSLAPTASHHSGSDVIFYSSNSDKKRAFRAAVPSAA